LRTYLIRSRGQPTRGGPVAWGFGGEITYYRKVTARFGIFSRLSFRLFPRNVRIQTHKTIIFLLVLYWCETWPLSLREGHMVTENRVSRKIFGCPREEVTGGWRKLHNEELSNCAPHQILLEPE
jgi:hypothetical protein